MFHVEHRDQDGAGGLCATAAAAPRGDRLAGWLAPAAPTALALPGPGGVRQNSLRALTRAPLEQLPQA